MAQNSPSFWFGIFFCLYLVVFFLDFLRVFGWLWVERFLIFFKICVLRLSAGDLNGVVPIYINSVDTYLAVD